MLLLFILLSVFYRRNNYALAKNTTLIRRMSR